MDSSCCDEDENQFFDACDEISVSCESDSDCRKSSASNSGAQFNIWVQNPASIEERRSKFFNWLGLSAREASTPEGSASSALERCSSFDHEFSSSRSSLSSWSGHGSEFHGDLRFEENSLGLIGIWDNEKERIGAEFNKDGQLGENNEVNANSLAVKERFEHSRMLPPLTREACAGENIKDVSKFRDLEKNGKNWWFRKLCSFSCVTDTDSQRKIENSDSLIGARFQRVKVRQCSKKYRELSALYSSQEFQAHEGPISVMKFSPDGRYLASAGEDRIVRVWKVVEEERSNEVNIPDTNHLCLYFKMNQELELQPMYAEKERMGKAKSWNRNSGSACVILPPKVFRLFEKPVHEFNGHLGEISDLSWSSKNCLLSSSTDKTVRLWRVGCNHCLKVFSHNNYVTSIQFNPMDDKYFISGSVDGKVRVWEISACRVISWTDIKDIVTAVSYHPDGQGVLVGSIAGFCRFYNISDGQLELEGQVCIRSKKKSSGKRIIGFQYCPQESSKVMVTCADSQVRILSGMDVIRKYKGNRGCGNYLSASFTADGKHIVSTCEDSNVYVWNCANHDDQDPSRTRKFKSSERFQSNALVAIPWNGFQNVDVGNRSLFNSPSKTTTEDSPSIFPLEQEFFLESYYPKGSQTWPEENLPAPAHPHLISTMQKSEYKFLRACQSISSPHIWGLVIVTAGLDGRIRSFHNYGLPVSV